MEVARKKKRAVHNELGKRDEALNLMRERGSDSCGVSNERTEITRRGKRRGGEVL